ncbi:MAG TPA: glycosyltransferase family 4 protein [Candidatus Woesebacteria bacterium]|jgi:glycosyltransferase involved in cell wall biosynthesis|nr:glycosyltransferase family 4 protein [Candidatus Shapirobacteria bacterium]HOR01751.1 glycosyltransferase family 4 protein [Candidatus Woesebacteria bacterium]
MRPRKPIKVIYISTYIPQKCGIATFTKDVTTAINLINPKALAEIMAVVKEGEEVEFPWEVKYRIEYNNRQSYINAAEYINQSSCDVVLVEHEFGIFGGKCGEYLIDLLKAVDKPKVMTCHTLIEEPENEWGKTFRRLIKHVDGLTVMTKYSARKLSNLYKVKRNQIAVIPHGTPDMTYHQGGEFYKKKKKLTGRLVLGNINLLSENKGIDYSIEAVAKIAKEYPEVLYVVVGQTHPNILAKEGEKYRNSLKDKIKKLGIQKNVKFVNKYVSLEELIEWLYTFDGYITPYLDKQQSSSGALAYAVGAGKICISTRYLYAKELLAGGRGVLVPFKDSKAIAKAVIDLFKNDDKRKEMQRKAYEYGRFMTWSNVALQHLDFFAEVIKKHETKKRQAN